MTTPNETPREAPSLFDSRGVFVPLSDDDLHSMSAAERDSYQAIHEAYSEVAGLERRIEVAGRNLHDRVAELRDAEHALATIPKPTQVDLVREMAAQTAGRA